ncbi:beta-phosphoglucomutase [Roseivirga misakiensis]|uniref:Beta-phosphoglucomutase n=1 Tax=Roseivirga misakiensis TaxID=1563681 RepID=A0A1E5T0C5_9BACT|nr:beta-phosphoglucomutase [Roseivirga misakiensis]OEK04805.1 beta-phosphoglucomutase [Roseivirga misakiensis]
MNSPKACIFDLDGVIVDTVPAHYTAWKAMADEVGVAFDEKENENLKGVSRFDSMKHILSLGNIEKTDEEIQAFTEKKNAIYVDIISSMTPADILPGVVEFIDKLKANGIAIAIGSASKNTPTILKCVGLEKVFKVIVDGNQITNSKPDPEVFLKGAAQLGVEPKECVVLEDAISGVKAAKSGGMKCIGVGHPDVLSEADIVVNDLTNVDIDFLKALYSNEELHQA